MSRLSKLLDNRGSILIDTLAGVMVTAFVFIGAIFVLTTTTGHVTDSTIKSRLRSQRYIQLEIAIREKVFELEEWDIRN